MSSENNNKLTMKNRDVTFRRINGRIVPIKINKERKLEAAKGAVIAAAGVGVGLASGKIYKEAVVRSAQLAFRATDSLRMARSAQLAFRPILSAARAEKALKFASRTSSAAGFIRKFSAPVSSALIGFGFAKIGSALFGKDNRESVNSAAIAAGGAAAASSFLVGMHGKQGLVHLARKYRPALANLLKR